MGADRVDAPAAATGAARRPIQSAGSGQRLAGNAFLIAHLFVYLCVCFCVCVCDVTRVIQLKFATLCQVPIGNMAGDFLRVVSDVHMARTLRNDASLLWMSPSDRPDLGGAEADEFQVIFCFIHIFNFFVDCFYLIIRFY